MKHSEMEQARPLMPCLWFNLNAHEALAFYGSVFKDFSVRDKSYYPNATPEAEGTLMTAVMIINGSEIMLLNAGTTNTFNETFSFVIKCAGQQEVDYYWEKLLEDGGSEMACSWLRDRFGVCWQVVPNQLMKYITHPDREKASRAMQAMMQMTKIDIAAIEAAANGM